jgi:hypothetical protein
MKNNLLISSFVTLTLMTTGCSDNKNTTVKPPSPKPPINKTATATFNVAVTGVAVKGTMANASISIHQIDTTTGEKSPISFRITDSIEAESYTVSAPAGTSDEKLDEMLASKVLAENPLEPATDENGKISIYLESTFSGAVIINITSSSSVDASWLRCDSYTDCGIYENIASTVMPNNGDLAIEFGEWYKEDLTLTTIKYIPESASPEQSRRYSSNVTVFTEVVATILQDNLSADPMVPISQQAISDASVHTVMQLLGPNGVIKNANLLSDISKGVGFDLSDIGENVSLNAGNLALAQLSASLQTVAAAGDNGTLSEIITELATSVSDGSLNAVTEVSPSTPPIQSIISKVSSVNNNSKPSALFNAIQQRVKKIAAIYVAIVTGDTAALDALGVNAGIRTSITKSMENAVKRGAISQQDLINTAIEVVALVEKIGCIGDECTIGDELYADIAAKVTTELTMLNTKIMSIANNIDTAAAAIITAEALETRVTDADTAIIYYESAIAAYFMIFNSNDVNVLGNKANRYDIEANDWADTAKFLVASSSEYQSLLDTAQDIAELAHIETIQINGDTGLHIDVQALLADAQAKLVEFDAVVPAAKARAESSNDMALTKQGIATTAQTTSVNSYETAIAMNSPQSVAAATAFLMATEQALTDKLDFISIANAFLEYSEIALNDAQKYADIAEDDADKTAAATLIDSATALISQSKALIILANKDVNLFTRMVADAKAKQIILSKLPMVKTTTQSFADINVVTILGRDALTDIGQIMFDVLEEANQETGNVIDKASLLHTGWIYSFNETNMTIEASHETKGSFQGVAELSNDASDTTLLLAWEATLMESGDNGATLEFAAGDLDGCATGNSQGSCSALTFSGVFTSLSDLDTEDPVKTMSSSTLAIMDSDANFTGTLILSNHDLSTNEQPNTFKTEVIMAGMSADVAFNLTFNLDEMDDNETLNVKLLIGDDGYKMMGSADNGAYLMGTIWLDDYKYGDFVEMSNGVVVTYIDDDEVEYFDLTFTIGD